MKKPDGALKELLNPLNAFTHVQIACIVNNTLIGQFGIRLDKRGFLFGSIEPDLSSACFTHPHRLINYHDDVIKEIDFLCNTDQDIAFGQFSRRLGNLCHYISDFFCFAHNERFEGGSARHAAYEFKLQGHAWGHNPSLRVRQRRNGIAVFESPRALWDNILSAHEDYMKMGRSCRTDMEYAVKMCTDLVSSVSAMTSIAFAHDRVFTIAPTMGY